MIRYVKQKRKTECGPVALLNVGKTLGLQLSYYSFADLVRSLCKCDENGVVGTDSKDFDLAIHLMFDWLAKIEYLKSPNKHQVDSAISYDTFIVLKFRRPATNKGHYTVVTGHAPGYGYTVINFGSRYKTIDNIPEYHMDDILSNSGHTKMWKITPRR